MNWESSLVASTITGALTAVAILTLERLFGKRVPAKCWRTAWLLCAAAFLLPVHWKIPVLPAANHRPASNAPASMPVEFQNAATAVTTSGPAGGNWLPLIWLAGVGVGIVIIAGRTFLAARDWRESAFSTDPRLLTLFEECRRRAGVHQPVGLIVSDRVRSAAALGWLHPRILLPRKQMQELSTEQMRDVLLHELAHIRSADLAWEQLFSLAVVLHWFNPFAHFAIRRWRAVREETADARVLDLTGPDRIDHYAGTLLHMLKSGQVGRPLGALGISESALTLKNRIKMIHRYSHRTIPGVVAALGLVLLGTLVVVRPVAAQLSEEDQKAAAVAAMETWLHLIDEGDYATSWKDASELFRKAVTEEQWSQALTSTRGPIGKLKERTLASALYQTEIPHLGKETLKGEFVIAQFRSSFENLASALETVTFQRAPDGKWHASGYFIKPG